ncbi:hypothetical protein DL766_005395 [Monosporascus sp. MC13-8B]|uniref:Uncharacterized protein n=1 Tax=Monosporascus cannonballus TaxID=155416 RepID=A0ABY0HIQ2_9PEZI|nr:hypothetical protein DL762_002215 [Monosporascus cannonballus]RYP01326.1 hypothetical protein DL763_000298 [Monosporascus cannonballus]RYP29377.1 hypothetical protein DL766_005395 [Monosporascus sp. MC13-8B]
MDQQNPTQLQQGEGGQTDGWVALFGFRPFPTNQHIRLRPRPRAFRHAVFRCLEWPIFEPLNSIRILDADEHGQQRWSPLFADDGQASPMSDVLNQPATDPPRSRMRVVISDIHFSESWQDDEALARRPAPLVIENRGGEPITVGQFIQQLSDYAAGLRDILEQIIGDIGGRVSYYSTCKGPPRENVTDENAVFAVESVQHYPSDRARHWELATERWRQQASQG